MNNYYKWVFPKFSDKSVKNDECLRVYVAKEQVKMKTIDKITIVSYVNAFLNSIGMEEIEKPEINLKRNPIKRGSYTKIMKEYKLSNKKDIVWMKFTKDNFLGVVATSNDINFSMDNTSGKIIKALGQQWDESFVLVFPLINIPQSLNRQRIESGIGNYLISKNVPILDYYSHNL